MGWKTALSESKTTSRTPDDWRGRYKIEGIREGRSRRPREAGNRPPNRHGEGVKQLTAQIVKHSRSKAAGQEI